MRTLLPGAALLGLACASPAQTSGTPERLFVDAERGRDAPGAGCKERPLRTLSAALARLPDPVEGPLTIEVRGSHATTGAVDMPAGKLVLDRRMRVGARVDITGQPDSKGGAAVFAWAGDGAMVDAREGEWRISGVQIGTFSKDQRRGVMVQGPAEVTLDDVTFRTRSNSDAAIYAHRGGKVTLRGAIKLNEHLHDEAPDESFCGIIATDHGSVRFGEREGASLDIGNGSLSASYWGAIRLGCQRTTITSWGRQSNNLAVNNSGRIDLHDTDTTLRARVKENTPIGPEHDGHILAEGAHIIIEGNNDSAITLQKASTFTCNDIELRGTFRKTVWAMSGSLFVGRFLTDVTRLEAHTGAGIHVEAIDGKLLEEPTADSGAVVSLPGGRVVR